MYGWAPLALLGEEINKLETSAITQGAYGVVAQQEPSDPIGLSRLPTESGHIAASDDVLNREDQGKAAGFDAAPSAGVYLSVWNIYATIPQFLATFISLIAFSILEPGISP